VSLCVFSCAAPFKTILAELKILKLENRWMFSCFNDLAFQTVIKSIFNINISADIDSLQHTTEATQKNG
jgi:hypothetical protein